MDTGSDSSGGSSDSGRKTNNSKKPKSDSGICSNRLNRRGGCSEHYVHVEGERVKKLGIVLQRRKELFGNKQTNVNCRVETFGRVVGLFGSDGREFPLSPLQVEWVLGTPVGPRRIPLDWKAGTAMDNKVKAVTKKYGTIKSGRRWPVIILEKAVKVLEGNVRSEDEKKEFMTAFLIFALATVLCPTTCTNLAAHLLPAATLTEDCREYDWSSLILEHLLQSAKSFHRKFQQKGAVSGCGGCTIFLAVFYLDRLKRVPVHWGENPRIKVWRLEEIKKARKEDRQQGGDFGNVGTIDVAYGDERHPMEARDKRMKPVADDVEEVEPLLGSDTDEMETAHDEMDLLSE